MRISDLGKIVTGKTPTTKDSALWNGTIPFVTPGDIQGTKHIFKTARYISDFGLQKQAGVRLPKKAVCVSCIGNIGYVGMTTETCITNQQINSIIAYPDHNPDYIYYLLKSLWSFFKHYEGQSTTLSILNKTQFSNIEIPDRTREEEDNIAIILNAIDEKIETNEKVNDNLLQQAMALFISWFISFDPFSGIMPGNWSETILDDVCSLISRGITPKYDEASDQMVINQKCIRAHTLDLSPARHYLPKVVNEKWLKFGDLLINSTGEGTLGRTAQVYFEPCNMTVDSHVTIVRPAKENLIFYVGMWGLLHEREIEALHTGSTGQTELPRERLKAMKILLPDQDTLVRFNTTIAPLTKMIVHNQDENRRLSSIRDYLLPRLMSGEIDVSNITI